MTWICLRVASSLSTARAVVSTAIRVVGETIQTRARCASATSSGKWAWISANTASAGMNITAPSAVSPGIR